MPATGGTGASQACSDTHGYQQIPVDLEQQTADTKDAPIYHCDLRNGVAVTITPTTVVPAGRAVYVALTGCRLTTAGRERAAAEGDGDDRERPRRLRNALSAAPGATFPGRRHFGRNAGRVVEVR